VFRTRILHDPHRDLCVPRREIGEQLAQVRVIGLAVLVFDDDGVPAVGLTDQINAEIAGSSFAVGDGDVER